MADINCASLWATLYIYIYIYISPLFRRVIFVMYTGTILFDCGDFMEQDAAGNGRFARGNFRKRARSFFFFFYKFEWKNAVHICIYLNYSRDRFFTKYVRIMEFSNYCYYCYFIFMKWRFITFRFDSNICNENRRDSIV